ncbi:RNA polymerase sigma factor [Sulfitobacter sp. HNIBRBA3233]|uniref:RNA polymerase sigma factor n=1 Tax=Sulfitobacter marinivivus TaxID=3158558 RepID=UPI0032DEBA19
MDTLNETEEARSADAALLARYAAGDVAAARILSARFAPRVYAHAHRVLGNVAEAEDVTQEAMVRLWKQAPRWEAGRAQASTWLYRVTANLCTDRLRRVPDTPLDTIAAPEDPAPSAVDRLQAAAREDALQAALMRLPERQRQAVVLRHLEGLANTEIAEILGIGTEAVESLTARGKRALSADLAQQREALGYEDDRT